MSAHHPPARALLRAGRWAPAVTAPWVVGVLALIACSARRDTLPGDPGAPPGAWPAGTTLVLAPVGHTLVLLAHPLCPCTAASLDELEGVLREATAPARAYILLVRPEGADERFEHGAALARARDVTGAHALVDVDGREAALFGARTSGHVLAFDARGRRVFAGGLTPTRGGRGDSSGRRALLTLLGGGAPAAPGAPVFGCPLVEGTK